MNTTMWILLTAGISVVGAGLTQFTRSLIAYRQWRGKLNLVDLSARKAARNDAAAQIADFVRYPHADEELDAALANYALDAETLAVLKQFLQAHRKEADAAGNDYTDLFNEIAEILVNYEQRLQKSIATNKQPTYFVSSSALRSQRQA